MTTADTDTLQSLISSLDWPTTSREEWRYSRLDTIDLSEYHLPDSAATPATSVDPGQQADIVAIPDRAATVVMANGRIVSIDVDPAVAAQGVRVGPLRELDPDAVLPEPQDAFVELNARLGAALLIDIPRNVTVVHPIVVSRWVSVDGLLALPRVMIRSGENSHATIVEFSGSSTDHALVIPVTTIDLAQASRLSHVSIQQFTSGVNQIGINAAVVGQQATLSVGHIALGGNYARMRFDCELVGRGASGSVSALYAGNGTQMHDLRTYQKHLAPDTTSDLVFKGAIDDESHAVYTGMIRISPDGRGTNATQSNRIIKLSPDAWAESVPNLEIEQNDVKCAHASTVGPIDEDQRFYLESRGIPPEVGERLVVNGFFAEVIDSLPVPSLAARLKAAVENKIGRA